MLEARGDNLLMPVPALKVKRLGLTTFTKKQFREEGRLTSQAMQQGRKVQNLLLGLLKQYLAEQSAKNGRKFSRQDFAGFRQTFESALLEVRRDFFKVAAKVHAEKMEKAALHRLVLQVKQPLMQPPRVSAPRISGSE